MELSPIPVSNAVGAFLLAFPAIFSIVNPIGGALIFHQVTSLRARGERRDMAARIAFILNFFGIGLNALRIGGGLVVASTAWTLLMRPEVHEKRKSDVAGPVQDEEVEDSTFFPLTMPLTTGPGTISVVVALSSQRPAGGADMLSFFAGASVAAICVAATVWICYRSSDGVTDLLGPDGARVVSRLIAFILLCVGVQIIVTGVTGVVDLYAIRR
jgi:multiple antibiotic resistance protein